jgi:hypothetical protein
LAFDDDEIRRALRSVEDERFGRAGREIGDDAIDRYAPAGDHDPGLSGRDERGAAPGTFRCGTQFQRDGHLTDGAVIADEQQGRRRHLVHRAREERRFRRFANVPNPRAAVLRRAFELLVLAEHVVKSAHDLEFGVDGIEDLGTPGRRQCASSRCCSNQQRSRPIRKRITYAPDDRCVAAQMRRHVAHVLAGKRWIDDRDDLVTAVGDYAVRRLCIVGEVLGREHGVFALHAATRSRTPSPGAFGSTSLP